MRLALIASALFASAPTGAALLPAPALAQRHADIVYLQQFKAQQQAGLAAAKPAREVAQALAAPAAPAVTAVAPAAAEKPAAPAATGSRD